MRSGDYFARFVEDTLGAIRGFRAGEGEPKLNGEGDNLDCVGKENTRIVMGGFEVDSFFPMADGVRDMFERCIT